MNIKYKVRFFVECMVTINVEADQNTPPEEIVKEAYRKTNLYDEVDKGNAVFTEDIIDIIVDKYNANGELQETIRKTPMPALFGEEEKSI